MQASPFSSTSRFHSTFSEGLHLLARESDLGAFILAAANASTEAALFKAMLPSLHDQFHGLHTQLREQLTQGRRPQVPQDDLMVFLQLALMGLSALRITEERHAGIWTVQFNPLRALRPSRAATRKDIRLAMPFDTAGFHFDRDFLRREVFWEGTLHDLPIRLLYNKFPFARMHGILVPEPTRHLPQYLTERHHCYAFSVVNDLADLLPGLSLAYNSLGAYASVNHLHFQLFVDPTELPAQAPQWQHNGGSTPYPAQCLRFDNAQTGWHCIESLHKQGQPYNLLYSNRSVLVFPRPEKANQPPPSWSPGFAWFEMCGAVVTANRETFEQLGEDEISGVLAACSSFAPVAGHHEA